MSKVIGNDTTLAISSDELHIFKNNDYQAIEYKSHSCQKNLNRQQVNCLQFSPCGQFIVLCVQKELFLFQFTDKCFICAVPIEKTASNIQFFHNSEKLLICDRSGSVHIFKYSNEGLEKEELSFGHNSFLTDVLITPNDDFIITADRDEKIRITNYPNVYNIESYCLGHEQFISNICLLPHDSRVLVSVSGDGTLRLWNYVIGHQLMVFKEDDKVLPIEKAVCISSKHSEETTVAILRHAVNSILILQVKGQLGTDFEINITTKVEVSATIIDMCSFRSSFICLIDSKKVLEEICNSTVDPEFLQKVAERLDTIKLYKATENFEVLFKREFDNLQEYHARKKARINEKHLK